jgi:hypothetical protein
MMDLCENQGRACACVRMRMCVCVCVCFSFRFSHRLSVGRCEHNFENPRTGMSGPRSA